MQGLFPRNNPAHQVVNARVPHKEVVKASDPVSLQIVATRYENAEQVHGEC